MPSDRVENDRIVDEAILLTLLRQADSPLGRTHLTKAVFKTELDLRHQGAPSPSWHFYRFTHGPFSRELYVDVDALKNKGFVAAPQGASIHLTRRGRYVAEYIHGLLAAASDWQHMTHALSAALRFVKPRTATELKAWSHDLHIVPDRADRAVRIHDLEPFDDILTPRLRPGRTTVTLDAETMEKIAYNLALTDQDVAQMRRRVGPFESVDALLTSLDAAAC